MSAYNFFGSLNSLFIIVSLFGILSQLLTLRRRRASSAAGATELLSLNQFVISFLAYWSFFVYGYSVEPFLHYLVWPRLIAAVLVAAIVWEIWHDRRSRMAGWSLAAVAVLLMVGAAGMLLGKTYLDQSKIISTSLILIICVLLAQGYAHQILLILRSGKTGAVDIKMSQFILLMDVSTLAFALSMGLDKGWPLLCLAVTSGITKLAILYLFRWVRVSSVAKMRRAERQLSPT